MVQVVVQTRRKTRENQGVQVISTSIHKKIKRKRQETFYKEVAKKGAKHGKGRGKGRRTK